MVPGQFTIMNLDLASLDSVRDFTVQVNLRKSIERIWHK